MSPYVNTTRIVYKNNEGNFTLWIPVEITYYWGTLKAVPSVMLNQQKQTNNRTGIELLAVE